MSRLRSHARGGGGKPASASGAGLPPGDRGRSGAEPVRPPGREGRNRRGLARLRLRGVSGNLAEDRLAAGGERRRRIRRPISEHRIGRSITASDRGVGETAIDGRRLGESGIGLAPLTERDECHRLPDERVGLIGGDHGGTAILVGCPPELRRITGRLAKVPVAHRHQPRGPQPRRRRTHPRRPRASRSDGSHGGRRDVRRDEAWHDHRGADRRIGNQAAREERSSER